MLEKIKKYVEKWHMLENGDRVITGVSGGADSICLLFVLMELQKEISFEIVVVHVNHGLRGAEADADEKYVKEICEKYHIRYVSYLENIELIAKKRKQSMEEAGREVRREAFSRTMKEYGGTKTALAHHKNDNVETFMMNLARGTGLRGLGGIHPVKGNIIRPLLCVERSEIEQYLDEQKIVYCVDQTNKSDDYTRNRIRNHILPYFTEEINAKTVRHVSETMEHLREIQSFMEEQTRQYWRTCVAQEGEKYVIKKEAYELVPAIIRPLVLREILVLISGREKDIESVHLNILQELMEKQSGRKADLPYEIEARRVYQGIEISKKKNRKQEEKEEVVLDAPEREEKICYFGGKKIKYCVLDKTEAVQGGSEKVYTKWFDYDIINRLVSVRTRKPGDYITINQMGGTQKLKSYFINEKIPQEKRDKILLVAEGSHILWIAGYRMNSAYQVNKHTKQILEIQIDEGEKNYGRDN